MSLVSINDVLKITTKVEEIHPYKVVGDRDSYSPYNEGWNDCVSLIESYLEKIPFVEPEERTVKATAFDKDSKGYWATDGRCEGCRCYLERKYNYCPRCGAKLDWSENE